jgi:xanthine dehydrogenase YagS FAD-binding subunit
MKPFEYAAPENEGEAVALINESSPGESVLLAGGTDLMNLLRRDLIPVKRVVDLKNVPTLKTIQRDGNGVRIGALATLEQMTASPLLSAYGSLFDVIREIRAIQVQSNGTLGGDLCHLPNCWYFRNGYGLLGLQDGKSLVAAGDNRYHAILGHQGLAKFVSASRLAPGLISWGARIRILGPERDAETLLPLEEFYRIPKSDKDGISILRPGQFISHVWLPDPEGRDSAAYEVLEGAGLDYPTAAASVCLKRQGSLVQQASIVLGAVAPIPWNAARAAESLRGQPITEQTAAEAAHIALAGAVPLSDNAYKIRQARAAVKRSLLRAVGLWEEGVSA